MYEVHVSGHACQEELKIIQGVCKPKYFIPVHGEQAHLRKHAMLAKSMGMDDAHVFIRDIGNVIELNRDYMEAAALPSRPAACWSTASAWATSAPSCCATASTSPRTA